MLAKIFNLSSLALFTALGLSTIAAWYSIIGLTAIFAGAVIPVIIMGGALEFAKIVTTVWLRHYWHRCGLFLKSYLVTAVVVLAMLTSMGIFGFLSRAHIEQGMPTGDITAQIALIDEKIKTQRDNIDMLRKALTQMDAQIDQRLGRAGSEQAAERAVVLRRQQQAERTKIAADIEKAQKEISRLNEERAPIATQLRKVEAEVGPVKYIAALIYGDNPNADILERAVRWVIILLVAVFDPLAIMLVLAANSSREWDRNNISNPKPEHITPESIKQPEPDIEPEPEQKIDLNAAYLKKPWAWPPSGKPIVAELPVLSTEFTSASDVKTTVESEPETKKESTSTTKKAVNAEAYSAYTLDTLPDAGRVRPSNISFGETAPKKAVRGDLFIGTKSIPHTVLKYDGVNWRRVDKLISTGYLLDRGYISYLVQELESGNYDLEFLTEQENAAIEEYLLKNKSQAK